jgi:hypothetical protein
VPHVVQQAAAVWLFLSVVLGVGVWQRVEQSLGETDRGVLTELAVHRRDMATRGASGYLAEAEVSSVEGAVKFVPLGLIYFLTVPHPWDVGSFRQGLVIPETMFWLALYPLILVGFRHGFRVNRPGALFIALLTGGLCVIYAVLSGNIGVAYRMRLQVWLLWAPFVAWGFEVWREQRTAKARKRRRLPRTATAPRRLTAR